MTVEDGKYVLCGPDPAEPLCEADVTLGKYIFDSLLANSANYDAMIDVFTGKTISYRTILQDSCNLAEAIRTHFPTNTVISICSENSVEFFIPVIAGLYAGCIMAPLNHNYTQLELEHSLGLTKPKIIFCSEGVSGKLVALKSKLNGVQRIVVIDTDERISGTERLKNFVKDALRGRSVLPYKFLPFQGDAASQAAFILCSSGTTGLPKGVLLSHRNIMVRFLQRRDPRYTSYQDTNSAKAQRYFLGLMPFFHGYGLNVFLGAIVDENPVIILKKFDEDVFLKAIQDYKISVLHLAPPLAVFLSKSPKVPRYDLSSVQEVLCGAAPLSRSTEALLKERLEVNSIRQGYGLTEATLAVSLLEPGVDRPGSCGKIISYMKGILRNPETGKRLGPNQVGELCFKGPMVMLGYYNDRKSTEESFTSDGWLKTGDLGYYDEDGYIYIVDRLKELIKYKGYQVAPAELEALLLQHPKVADAGVVGLPDELAGELPVAFVVKSDNGVTEKELQKYVADKVSPQKRLRGGVIFIEAIPKNPSGKILRRELRQLLKNYKTQQMSKL